VAKPFHPDIDYLEIYVERVEQYFKAKMIEDRKIVPTFLNIYLAGLKKLADTCDFQNYKNEALRDQLVCGIQSEATQKRLLAEVNLTLERALEIAQASEAISRHAGELQEGNKHHEIQQISIRDCPCYRCGRSSHAQEKCCLKSKNCRNCGKQRLIARVCRQRTDYLTTTQDERNRPNCRPTDLWKMLSKTKM